LTAVVVVAPPALAAEAETASVSAKSAETTAVFQKSFRHRIILCLIIRKRAVQPHSRHIHGVVQAVLFCLFDHTVAGFQIRVGELKLHGDPRRHVKVLDLFRVDICIIMNYLSAMLP